MVAKEHGTDSPVKRKLNEINTMWGRVQDKCNNKHKRLKDALREVKALDFNELSIFAWIRYEYILQMKIMKIKLLYSTVKNQSKDLICLYKLLRFTFYFICLEQTRHPFSCHCRSVIWKVLVFIIAVELISLLECNFTTHWFIFQAKSFAGDLQDTLAHMSELEDNLITSTPVGGLPETAKEQFEKFMVNT